MTEQEYLEKILNKQKIPDYIIDGIRNYREEIEKYLRLNYWIKIENFYYSWSIARWTAIYDKYDIDLCVYFGNNSFNTLEEMFKDIKNVLWKKYLIKEQRVSIWISTMNIDVVPWRKINDSWTINLWDSKDKTWKQTNIVLHKKYISENWDKQIIKLLKVWKLRQNIDIKSFALEILSIQSLKSFSWTWLWNKMRHIWNYIKNKDIYSMQIIDPANSNNNIMDSIDDIDKQKLQNKATEALNKQYWEEILW